MINLNPLSCELSSLVSLQQQVYTLDLGGDPLVMVTGQQVRPKDWANQLQSHICSRCRQKYLRKGWDQFVRPDTTKSVNTKDNAKLTPANMKGTMAGLSADAPA